MAGGVVRLAGVIKARTYERTVPPGGGTPTVVEKTEDVNIIFTTSNSTFKFLDIPETALVSGDTFPTTKVEAHERNITSLDGANIKTTQVEAHERALSGGRGRPGSKTAILITGKKAGKSFQQCSFRFPGNATVKQISDLLGSIIPAGRIKANPSATEVRPDFRLKGGGTYPIMKTAAAEASVVARPGRTTAP